MMRSLRFKVWVDGICAALWLASAAAWAQSGPAATQPTPTPVIVMVDMQQLVYNSKAAKSVQSQMDKERESFSKEVAEQEDLLQRARADLERQHNVMAPDQLEAKSREFQQKLEELDRSVQARQRAWQEEAKGAIEKVQEAALQVVAEIAAARHANLVIQKAAVVLGTDGFDITTDALARLDQRLPNVTLVPSKDAPAAETITPASPAPAEKKN